MPLLSEQTILSFRTMLAEQSVPRFLPTPTLWQIIEWRRFRVDQKWKPRKGFGMIIGNMNEVIRERKWRK